MLVRGVPGDEPHRFRRPGAVPEHAIGTRRPCDRGARRLGWRDSASRGSSGSASGSATTCSSRSCTSAGGVAGVQRKRQLGEGEEGFATSATPARFTCGGVPFGIVICAESHVDFTWDASVAEGERLVCFCSAPGLDERCTTEETWRRASTGGALPGSPTRSTRRSASGCGWRWPRRPAPRIDEDFPGIAALVDPTGEVVDRLPDWRPGTLVVDVPSDGTSVR